MIERWKFIHKKKWCTAEQRSSPLRKAMEEGMSILPLSDYKENRCIRSCSLPTTRATLPRQKQLYEDQFVFCEEQAGPSDRWLCEW